MASRYRAETERINEASNTAMAGNLSPPQCHTAEVVVDGHREMP
jgi:hypothetical protein